MEDRSPSIVDALMCPDETASYLASAPPGPDLIVPLSVLRPDRLSRAGRVDALVALERAQAWLIARQQRLLAVMAEQSAETADPVDPSGKDWVREDVSCALRLSGVTAQHRLTVARELAGRLPATLALIESGSLTYAHARTVADSVRGLDDDAAVQVEARVLRRAAEQTLAQFTATVRRAVASVAAATIEEARQRAVAERRVCITARDDGMAEL